MAFSPSHAMINGLQAAKQNKSQGISTAASFNGSHLNKYHHAHGVSHTPAQGATVLTHQISLVARTHMAPHEGIAACPRSKSAGSPFLLSWANLADSGEYIPKEALELEKDYGGFTLNFDFLINQCVAPRRSSPKDKREGRRNSGRGEWNARSMGASASTLQSHAIGSSSNHVQQACDLRNHAKKAISPIKPAPPTVTHSRMAFAPPGPHHTLICTAVPTIQTVQQMQNVHVTPCPPQPKLPISAATASLLVPHI
ncbi:hypothetical protein F0562_022626 [Nyssa sinensis]|uniref:Uncharacterized protein n=1 Tax=Nyssa sinensis TaxID=561372 RepID=A0A5J5BN81_9ASTE|nr:hypothetical protein F0562_022626 [Nyssa sinensis]